jgi:hypothetical protein
MSFTLITIFSLKFFGTSPLEEKRLNICYDLTLGAYVNRGGEAHDLTLRIPSQVKKPVAKRFRKIASHYSPTAREGRRFAKTNYLIFLITPICIAAG